MAGWLDSYMGWTKDLESPTRYHLWSAIAAAGHVLGRNVGMLRMGGKWVVFPGQILVVLVGPTAVKKDTAMNQSVNLLRALPKGVANILPERTSPQELLNQLAAAGVKKPNVGFIYASEMGTFFGTESYMDGMVTMVTNLWNAPTGFVNPETMVVEPHVKEFAFRSWKQTLRDPAIGGIMAITPEGVATELPPSARKRGFMGRCLWVYEAMSDRPPNPGTSWVPEETATRDRLLEGLEKLATLKGMIWFTKQGREWFDDWYVNVHSPAVASSPEEAQETGYMGRKADHLLRVAITLACLAHIGDEQGFTVSQANLQHALRLLETAERNLPRVIGEVGRAPVAEKMAKFLRYLEPGMKRRKACMSYLWKYGVKDREEFDRLVSYATEMDAIVTIDDGKCIWYRLKRKGGQELRRTTESVSD